MTLTKAENLLYWNQRAKNSPANATTNDYWLRYLEFQVLKAEIRELNPSSVLDIGCGDAYTTIRLALAFPEKQFFGMDYSEEMLLLAAQNVELQRYSGNRLSNLSFIEDDLLTAGIPKVDLVISCRCLINLPTQADQYLVIHSLEAMPYRLIENFVEPNDKLNMLRAKCGLEPIQIADHNLYLDSRDYISKSFADTYYFATRVIYAYECLRHGIQPNYLSDNHERAVALPNIPALNCAPMRLIR